jgi:cytochrome P450
MALAYDPFSPRWRDDPYPAYASLRKDAPVHRVPETGVFCVSRHDDVVYALKRPELFSSRAMFTVLMSAGTDGALPLTPAVLRLIFLFFWRLRLNPFAFARARNLIAEDPPVHETLRGTVNRGFTPRRIAEWEPRIRELVARQLAPLARSSSWDVVHELAVPLPVTVIAEMLGVETERMRDFKRWTDTVIEGSTGAGRATPFAKPFVDSMISLIGYLRGAIQRRREAPGDDLISALLAEAPGGTRLSDVELVLFVQLLLVAGNETTTNLIGNAVQALLDHRDQLALVAADPSLVPALVEETLRFDAPVQMVFRTATADHELAGVRIPKGATLALLLGSANRDESRFPDPDVFDVTREPRGHLGFGFGEHFCLGAALARLEARVALEALVPELMRLERTGARETIDSFLVRGPKRLELRRAGRAGGA